MMPSTSHGVDLDALSRIAAADRVEARAGVCRQPIRLTGRGLLVEAGTGRVLADTGDRQTILVRCRNRRAARCPACSTLYKLDAFHLIAAGLRDEPTTVAGGLARPRVFVTVTAPSFGPVHLGPARGGVLRRCHSDGVGCGRWHLPGDPLIGTPLELDGYDYPGQVLFNAHAGMLWARFTTEARRTLAAVAGLSRRQATRQVRMAFAKVAEFQARGVVHFHAIVRLDGPDGLPTPPPTWATSLLLETAIRRAVPVVAVATPAVVGGRVLRWGRQVDMQPLPAGDVVVARYVPKYATKTAEAVGVDVPPLFCRACRGDGLRPGDGLRLWCRACSGTGRRPGVSLDQLPAHGRMLVETCWRLGGMPDLRGLRLRRWAHQLGYRGHVTSKSLTYSTTFAALRDERRRWRLTRHAAAVGVDPTTDLLTVGDWRYTGQLGEGT
ncbi:replication initiator [Salinispora arenicola]|uniref:Replication initiation protein n=1 Tax=Salinispora arenicola TaxID=168697 RepID=A0A542XLS0_SALAC|nr:replication initiator [Salinispora arenicola]TQL36740.1 hypothetical protein FB564_1869 [Salinispora arenicola]GIM87188.1 replication initiation protein [Salinispora arenicola]